jgi:ribonuclease HI
MSFDGACSKSRSGVGIIFLIPWYGIYMHSIRLEFPCTNNKVECEALIQGMMLALQMRVENIVATGDS